MTIQTTSTTTWISTARDALTLKPEVFEQAASGRPSLRSAVLYVVVVGLIIGAVLALVGIPGMIRQPSIVPDEVLQQFDEAMGYMEMFGVEQGPEFDEVMDMVRGSIEAFMPQVNKIMAVDAPLPGIFGRFFTWIGSWISTPFGLLAKWLSISIWIMLFARLLGGRGSLLPFLMASSLSVTPHLLHAVGFIPCVGGIVWLVAGIWGLAIQYKAVQVVHRLSSGRALAAVLLPYILLGLLVGLGFTSFIALLAVASGSG